MYVNQKNAQNELVFTGVHVPCLSYMAAIGAKLIGPHGGLQVDKPKVGKVTGSVDSPRWYDFLRIILTD